MAKNRCIGDDGRLPWDLPEDMKHFRALTTGHPIIMGRKTFESIGRVLPNRENVIISRSPDYRVVGARVVGSLEAALEHFSLPGRGDENGPNLEIFVIGGGEIYRQALPHAKKLYLTLIDHDVAGDTFFPEWSKEDFREVAREQRDEPFAYAFVTLERVKS